MNRRSAIAPAALAAIAAGLIAAQAQDVVADLPDVVIRAGRPDPVRTDIPAAIGASATRIDREAIERLPQGADAPLNQVLLQAPGVAGDAQGDIHVRGDHRNLSYRVNGIAIPEAISGFAQMFDARALQSVTLITGALPAQFGWRNAGIVDLQLRSGAQAAGGSIGVQGGSFGTVQPSLTYGGTLGALDYHLSGSWLRSDRGFELPTRSRTAPNGGTEQGRGLLNLGYALDDRTRLALIAGTAQSRYQVPVARGLALQDPGLVPFGFDSASLAPRQWQRSTFGVVALQHSLGDVDLQVSGFLRQTSLDYLPSLPGELALNGAAALTRRDNLSFGSQADGTWRVAERHTLRFGLFVSADATRNLTETTALRDGLPAAINERSRLRQELYGAYLQDEWRLADTLTLNLGARFDVVRGPADGSQFSPRANLVWRPRETTTLAAGYARYFTPPPAELLARPDLRLYAGTTAAPAIGLIGAVLPESAHYFNLGWRERVTEALTIGVEAYYRIARNLQDLGQFGQAYIFSPYNYRDGRVQGVELSAQWRSGAWQLYGNLAYGRAEGRNPVSNQYLLDPVEYAYAQGRYVRLDHLQTLTGSAGASWTPWDGGSIGGTLVYASGLRKGFANSSHVTPYLTANLSFGQSFEWAETGRWTARLDVLNLGDRVYQIRDGTGLGVSAAQYGMRRGVFVALAKAL